MYAGKTAHFGDKVIAEEQIAFTCLFGMSINVSILTSMNLKDDDIRSIHLQ